MARASEGVAPRLTGLVGLVGFGLAALYALPSLWYPLGGDAALFQYVGASWWQGVWPYAGTFDHKPPVIFFIHAMLFGGFGLVPWGVRILDVLAILVMGRVIGSMATADSKLRCAAGGIAALWCSGFYYTTFDYWATGQAEVWMALFLTGAAWAAWRVRAGGMGHTILCGALCGLAFLTKFTVIVPAAGIFLLGLVQASDWACRARWAVGFLAGFAGAVLIVFLPFAFAGLASEAWQSTVSINYFYLVYSWRGMRDFVPTLFATSTAWYLWPCLMVGSFGMIWSLRQRGNRLTHLAPVFLACLAALSVVLQRKYFAYHWVVMVPFMALVFLAGLATWPKRFIAASGLMTILVVTGGLLTQPWMRHNWPPFPAAYRDHIAQWMDCATAPEGWQNCLDESRLFEHYSDIARVGRIAARYAWPNDSMCVVNVYAPALYSVSGLRCPSRFFSDHMLTNLEKAPTTAEELGFASWLNEHRDVMATGAPTFLVAPVIQGPQWPDALSRPHLPDDFVDQYESVATSGNLMLFVRRNLRDARVRVAQAIHHLNCELAGLCRPEIPAEQQERERRDALQIVLRLQRGIDALYERNQPTEAIRHFQEVLDLAPGHREALQHMAVARDRRGD